MTTRWFGQPIKRVEDPDLLTGRGRFTDDIHLPGMLHAAFVRSPFAHAAVRGVDTSAACALAGVHAVLSAADLPTSIRDKCITLEVPNPVIRYPITQRALATDEVCFAGEAVAVAVAETRHLAEDAAELVVVDYEPLAAVSDCVAAIEPQSATAHRSCSDNIAAQYTLAYGDIGPPFDGAAHVISETYHQHRGTGCPMECRSVLARWEPLSQAFTIWTATQAPHVVKRAVADMFDMSETDVRVIAGDVGGGFGPKVLAYPEEMVLPYCARLLGRPVKWIEDRREHLMATAQERDQVWHVALACDTDGRIRGLRGRLLHDTGAYLPWGIIMPYIAGTTFPGPYVVPAYKFDTTIILTNKIATSPMRGAGRPQAVFAIERLLDSLARRIGVDRAEIRRRNLIPPDAMPYKVGLIYRDGAPLTYDSGDYPKCQQMALDQARWGEFRERQQQARRQGRYIGIGLANYVEGTGLGPFEGATTRVLPSGRILLRTGAAAQGQGHRTVLAQICADEFNVDVSQVDVEVGDTASIAAGVGTFASRMMVNAGSSVRIASEKVATKLKQIGAAYFDVDIDDIALENGIVCVTRSQGATLSFAEIGKMTSGRPGFALPRGIEPGLESTHYFAPPQAAYSNGTHIAEVEVDPHTGIVRILRYIVSHDCGKVINPMLVNGQIQGGVAHGIGNALLERMRYDADGNPVTTSLADYLVPETGNVPECEIVHMESPSPLNPLGVKGAGEGGTIPAAAAIISAVEDALSSFNVRILETPILPERILELIDEGRGEA
jgi:carbon-monoxide dehydrogenase large subunit